MARVSFPAFCAVPEYVFRMKTGIWRSRCVPTIGALFFFYFYIGSETKLSGAYDGMGKSQYVSKTVKARFRSSFPTTSSYCKRRVRHSELSKADHMDL